MKYFKIATMVLFMSVCLTMVSGSFAADNTILPIPIVNEKWINVGVGEKFDIYLQSNPSTGYTWMEPRFDSNFLSLTCSQFIPPVSNLNGAPGYQKYTFNALKAGDTQIIMEYKRPWENCIGEITLYNVNITE